MLRGQFLFSPEPIHCGPLLTSHRQPIGRGSRIIAVCKPYYRLPTPFLWLDKKRYPNRVPSLYSTQGGRAITAPVPGGLIFSLHNLLSNPTHSSLGHESDMRTAPRPKGPIPDRYLHGSLTLIAQSLGLFSHTFCPLPIATSIPSRVVCMRRRKLGRHVCVYRLVWLRRWAAFRRNLLSWICRDKFMYHIPTSNLNLTVNVVDTHSATIKVLSAATIPFARVSTSSASSLGATRLPKEIRRHHRPPLSRIRSYCTGPSHEAIVSWQCTYGDVSGSWQSSTYMA